MTTNPWFELGRQLQLSETSYRNLLNDAIESNQFERAAYWKGTADGLKYARNIQQQLETENRTNAVRSTTQTTPDSSGE